MKLGKQKLHQPLQYTLDTARIGVGLILVWAFTDNMFGLGFNTCAGENGTAVMCEEAWLMGGSPTTGFLRFGVDGPLAPLFNYLAGLAIIDWLFMLALLLGGVALILGIGMKLAVAGSSLLLFILWLAAFPPEHHPVISDHLIYILVLVAAWLCNDSQRIGLGHWWSRLNWVKKYPILK